MSHNYYDKIHLQKCRASDALAQGRTPDSLLNLHVGRPTALIL